MDKRRAGHVAGQCVRTARAAIGLGLLLGSLAACETVIDPGTGQTTLRTTLPGTAAHGERLNERWQRCLLINPKSTCSRLHPQARPTGAATSR